MHVPEQSHAAPEPAIVARRLLRAAVQASLATALGGEVHAALVTPVFLADLTPVLLLSALSRHTRHLRENPQCALLCAGTLPPGLANPQTVPRVSLACMASEVSRGEDEDVRARYLAVHPYAALYAGFGDFSFWRLAIKGGQLVEGFARAFTLDGTLLPDPSAVAAVAAVAQQAIAHCNADHADAVRLLGRAASGIDGAWRLVGVDVDGADAMCADARARLCWNATITCVAELQQSFVQMARAQREMS